MLNDGDEVYHPPSSGSFLVPHLPLIEEARKKGIKHFGHEHPLTWFMEDVRNGFEDEDVMCCNGCAIEIGRSGFICCIETCIGYNLHELCASLPKEMKDHPQHPQHPLILCTNSPYPSSSFRCGVCKNGSWLVEPFCYHCEVCNFDVDLRCASMSFLVCPRTLHHHELTAHLHPASFLCSFCGEKHEELGMSYHCKICWFWINDQCYSLSQSIEHDSHVHPLKLCHLQGEDLPKCLCGVCEENISNQLGFYVCKSCKYYLHINCSTKKWDPPIIETFEEDQINDKLIQFPLPSIEVVHNTLAQFIKNICQWKEEEEEEEEEDNILNHPSHDHPLTLEFDLSKITNFSTISRYDYEVCNGCMLPLLNDAPYYSCNLSTCNFVLHKWCAKLPRELKHPAHSDTGHTLILDECIGFFCCKGCQIIGKGFAYKCNECESYYLDVRCAALPRLVNHETHEHTLLLRYGRSIGGCFLCGDSNFFENYKSMNISTLSSCPTSFTFGCDACNFSIHPSCLISPQEVVHWYDEHVFKLTDPTDVFISNDNQGASEYHCEFCEKKIDPERWMYHCFECDQCVDADCVRELFGLFPNPIKFGGLYDSPRHKEHPLTYIMTDNVFLCNCCNITLVFGIGFKCIECEIMFCEMCFIKGIILL
ncbi:uncharacterized protein LOC124934539 [Impatiens glandulifera]|uniref:uncharacterized protein LOC124934539 n=1 Tax=Impatiens glandulifera TaxID=253017 RepID=UPI001FB13DEC|nr:uncharacterized protein LOC124934539 [Impatiens glandulifera]